MWGKCGVQMIITAVFVTAAVLPAFQLINCTCCPRLSTVKSMAMKKMKDWVNGIVTEDCIMQSNQFANDSATCNTVVCLLEGEYGLFKLSSLLLLCLSKDECVYTAFYFSLYNLLVPPVPELSTTLLYTCGTEKYLWNHKASSLRKLSPVGERLYPELYPTSQSCSTYRSSTIPPSIYQIRDIWRNATWSRPTAPNFPSIL